MRSGSAGLRTPPPSSPIGADDPSPQSSQAKHDNRSEAITSPPATIGNIKPSSQARQEEQVDDEIEHMSAEELRPKLRESLGQVSHLERAYGQAETTIKNQTLQLRLLQLEMAESTKRHQVDLDLVQRELDLFLKGSNPELDMQKLRYTKLKSRYSRLKAETSSIVHELEVARGQIHATSENSDGGLAALGIVASRIASDEQNESLMSPAPIHTSRARKRRRDSDSTIVDDTPATGPSKSRQAIHRHPRRKLEFGATPL